MFTCKQVSRALSEEDYEKLPLWRKLGLKLHVGLCIFCGKYNRQVMVMQDTCRCYKQHEEDLAEVRPKLDDEHRNRIKEALGRQTPS